LVRVKGYKCQKSIWKFYVQLAFIFSFFVKYFLIFHLSHGRKEFKCFEYVILCIIKVLIFDIKITGKRLPELRIE